MSDLTVVGVFRHEDAAKAALRTLDEAGFPADRVGIVADNVRQAREVAGSRSPVAAVIGAVIGGLVGLGFGLASGMSVNSTAAVIGGVVMFAIIGAFIGALAGRGKGFRPNTYEGYQQAVDSGEALITIRCEDGQRAQAEQALLRAGATTVRIEGTAETV